MNDIPSMELETGKAVVILSGGIDSTVCLHLMKSRGHKVSALTVNYGQTHSREIQCAIYQASKVGVESHAILDLTGIGKLFQSALVGTVPIPDIKEVLGDPQPSTYVPFRNQILLSIAFGYAESIGAEIVVYGAQKHDLYAYWDTTLQFVQKFQSLADENRKHRIDLLTPLVQLSKKAVIEKGFQLDVDFAHCWTCYRGQGRACLTCPSCAERLRAFELLGLVDPLDWRFSKETGG